MDHGRNRGHLSVVDYVALACTLSRAAPRAPGDIESALQCRWPLAPCQVFHSREPGGSVRLTRRVSVSAGMHDGCGRVAMSAAFFLAVDPARRRRGFACPDAEGICMPGRLLSWPWPAGVF